ncbi:MAG TPA: hypothetical protein VFJ82_19440 [Longimicrobium sp.]|nr:hypothetical protein [Longimicrobium sp.]
MNKLKLNLEDVELESFDTVAPKESASGTVHGQSDWSWDWTVCLSGCHGTYGTGCDDSGDWSYCTCFTAGDSNCTMT